MADMARGSSAEARSTTVVMLVWSSSSTSIGFAFHYRAVDVAPPTAHHGV
jgi:hypothetical protein